MAAGTSRTAQTLLAQDQRPGTTRTLAGGDGSSGLVRRTVLPGGLRIVTEAVPTVRSVTVGIWVGVGSRDESPSLAGALKQAKGARLAILDVMQEAIDSPAEMNPTAPRIITIKVPVDKIGEVIGPKGKMINQIQDDTGAEITIEDDGTIYIGATDGPSAEAARTAINGIANPHMPEVGERYLGTVVKIAAFGAFVSLMPGKDGLLHVSQIRKLHGGKRIENVEDVMGVGEKIQVEIAEIDQRGKLSLVPVEVIEKEAAEKEAKGDTDEAQPEAAAPAGDDKPRDDRPRRTRTRVRAPRNDGDGGDRNS